MVTSFTVFWYLGLSLVTFNNQLHTWKLSELLLTWLGCGLAGSIMVSCLSVPDATAIVDDPTILLGDVWCVPLRFGGTLPAVTWRMLDLFKSKKTHACAHPVSMPDAISLRRRLA